MATEPTPVPRLVYRGKFSPTPVDDTHPDTIETKAVQTQEDLAAALKDGWRLKRVDKDHAAKANTDTIDVLAQQLRTAKK